MENCFGLDLGLFGGVGRWLFERVCERVKSDDMGWGGKGE